ncbi:MAG: exodeoxyribonuclease VII small subunit [Muribaculaceae bacterium]|nr:exodeoxyribonuclease VII small subunit [Muribaculaceae bacterium]
MELPADIKNMTYTQAVNELERIVNAMQQPDCDIDRLAEFTTRALQLMQHCKAKLTSTEEQIAAALSQISATC